MSMISRLTVIGVGLIGGSLARALKAAGACNEVVGWGRTAEPLQKALELGVIDRGETDLAAAVKGADVIVIGVPVGAMESLLTQLKPHLEAKTVGRI